MIIIPKNPDHIVVGQEMYKDILDMNINAGVKEPVYVSSIMSGVRLVADPTLSDGEYYMAFDNKMWLSEAYRDWRRSELARDFNRDMFLNYHVPSVPVEPEPELVFHDVSIWERYGIKIFNAGARFKEPKILKWNFEF